MIYKAMSLYSITLFFIYIFTFVIAYLCWQTYHTKDINLDYITQTVIDYYRKILTETIISTLAVQTICHPEQLLINKSSIL